MPYKDPQVRKARKKIWWKRFITENRELHNTQVRNWDRKKNLIPPSKWKLKPTSFSSEKEELEFLIAEQKKDDQRTQIKFGPGLQGHEDEAYSAA